jgi:hypothetical protein
MGNLKPKKQAIPADLLNNANSYDDKVALIRMIVADNSDSALRPRPPTEGE